MQGLIAFFALLIVIALLINGVVYLITNFWWVLLVVVVVVVVGAVWLYLRHPGLRAMRQVRAAAKRGQVVREDIHTTTERTKADMDHIVRDWNRRS